MNLKVLAMGVVASACMLALLLPSGSCMTTAMGWLGGGPDTVNSASCTGYFAQSLGRMKVSEGGAPVLLARLYAQAFGVAALLFAAAAVVARRSRDDAFPSRSVVATCVAMVVLTAGGLLWQEHGWFMRWDEVVSVVSS